MLEVCIASFYLSFFIIVLLKSCLLFVALKYSDGNFKELLKLMIIIDMILFFTIPLLMMLSKNVC